MINIAFFPFQAAPSRKIWKLGSRYSRYVCERLEYKLKIIVVQACEQYGTGFRFLHKYDYYISIDVYRARFSRSKYKSDRISIAIPSAMVNAPHQRIDVKKN